MSENPTPQSLEAADASVDIPEQNASKNRASESASTPVTTAPQTLKAEKPATTRYAPVKKRTAEATATLASSTQNRTKSTRKAASKPALKKTPGPDKQLEHSAKASKPKSTASDGASKTPAPKKPIKTAPAIAATLVNDTQPDNQVLYFATQAAELLASETESAIVLNQSLATKLLRIQTPAELSDATQEYFYASQIAMQKAIHARTDMLQRLITSAL